MYCEIDKRGPKYQGVPNGTLTPILTDGPINFGHQWGSHPAVDWEGGARRIGHDSPHLRADAVLACATAEAGAVTEGRFKSGAAAGRAGLSLGGPPLTEGLEQRPREVLLGRLVIASGSFCKEGYDLALSGEFDKVKQRIEQI